MQVGQCFVVFDAGGEGSGTLNADHVSVKQKLRQKFLVLQATA